MAARKEKSAARPVQTGDNHLLPMASSCARVSLPMAKERMRVSKHRLEVSRLIRNREQPKR